VSEKDERQLLQILEESYVLDMYVGHDSKRMGSDFHREFRILIPSFDGRSGRVTDVAWVKPDPDDPPPPKGLQPDQRFNMTVLDITGKVAVCKVEAFRSGRLRYTDYVTFTKIDGEWKIVAKAFHRHFTQDE
jgi:hypothetical protein